MSSESEIKRAVLKAVYEDNRGIPRSPSGKRPGHSAPPPAASPSWLRRAGLPAITALVVLVGFAWLDPGSLVEGSGPSAISSTAARDAPPALLGSAPAPGGGHEGESASGPTPYAGTSAAQRVTAIAETGHYDDMLRRLDVPVADLFQLSAQTIVIDPGHGGTDPGAVGHEGLMEKDVTLDIAERLREKLRAAGNYDVLLTREDDRKMRLKERVSFAKENEADLFVSLHVNSVPETAGPVNYVETYYFGPHANQRTLELARKENRDSDYRMADFREIISRIGDTLKTQESAQLATSIHHHLYDNLKNHSDDLLDAGTKTGPFVVLLGVEVPSVLIEISCISNEQEAERLGSPQYRDSVATYLETGILKYLEKRNAGINAHGVHANGVNTRDVAKQE